MRILIVAALLTSACTRTNPTYLASTACIDTSSDPFNCGSCGHDCTTLPGVASAICVAGTCVVQQCRSDRAHCTGSAADGCETDITSPAHCGSCTRTCPALCARAGSGYQCVSSCADPTPSQCGSSCVDLFSDAHHCGACATDCTLIDPAGFCASGGCILTAPPDFASSPGDLGAPDLRKPPKDSAMPADGPADLTDVVYACDSTTLYQIDPGTFAVRTIGGFNISFLELMLDVGLTSTGELYGLSNTTLYSVNASTGLATVKGMPWAMENGMTGLPGSGDLLSIANTGAVHLTNPLTLATQTIGTPTASVTDLAAVSDGTVYALFLPSSTSTANQSLVRISSVNGAVSSVGSTGFSTLNGLAYSRGNLLAFSSTGQIVQINPSTGAGKQVNTTSIQFVGAASSPLVQP